MYKRILVATDGSDASSAALNEAVRLARLTGATLLLLHVCEELPVAWSVEGMSPLPVGDVEKWLVEAGRKILQRDSETAMSQGVSAETRLIEDYSGNIGAAISAEAEKWQADLLAVGTHGRKGWQHMMLGSVAEGVVRTAKQPVLLIRLPG